jgi:hypothetical protein
MDRHIAINDAIKTLNLEYERGWIDALKELREKLPTKEWEKNTNGNWLDGFHSAISEFLKLIEELEK